jgi:polysaccharide deacetylase family protein (PEP-CTERM system associated)
MESIPQTTVKNPKNSIALTVDVEDYFQVTNFEKTVPRDRWDQMSPRVIENTNHVLDIFSEYGVKATFFVLGYVAQRNPSLVIKIAERGHEVASHGSDHIMVFRQTADQFREDVRKSKTILENIIGQSVLGYRAPTFSIVPSSKWAYSILAEEGYKYSSSVFPVYHDRYGWPNFGESPKQMYCENGLSIWEYPLPYAKFAGGFLPFGGGGYLRIYPLWLTMALIKRREKMVDNPTILYFHPWEIDPNQPRIPAPLLKKIRHYWGLSKSEIKIRKLLSSFPSGPINGTFF